MSTLKFLGCLIKHDIVISNTHPIFHKYPIKHGTVISNLRPIIQGYLIKHGVVISDAKRDNNNDL